MEFDGTASNRPLMDGAANVEEHVFHKSSGISRSVAIRAYDPKTAQWAIWWIDGRDPLGALDPPVKGALDNGVGVHLVAHHAQLRAFGAGLFGRCGKDVGTNW